MSDNVYIVIIDSADPATYRIGACYLEEKKADEEVQRLEGANNYTSAHIVVRQIEFD